ncbi:hypothetical protein ACPV5G_21045 [Photobacterium damselae]|uniref:hypothetical protein n=1 Tax=Photobacterium damselae TaxID=38293 RepID=UPI004068E08C
MRSFPSFLAELLDNTHSAGANAWNFVKSVHYLGREQNNICTSPNNINDRSQVLLDCTAQLTGKNLALWFNDKQIGGKMNHAVSSHISTNGSGTPQ